MDTNNNALKEFGAALRQHREGLGWSRNDLIGNLPRHIEVGGGTLKIGLTPCTLADLERGKRLCREYMLRAILDTIQQAEAKGGYTPPLTGSIPPLQPLLPGAVKEFARLRGKQSEDGVLDAYAEFLD